MKSSSAAQRLKLKQEQGDECSKMQGSRVLMSSLELRLGISSDNGAGCGSDPWLGVGVHPWSLAARQAEKVVLEQDHQRPPPQPVGWPPVGAFRRSHLQAGAKAVEEPTSKVRPGEQRPAPATTMFVKVNMEGCAVGRKVDLQAHRSYASLSRALQAMFHGFLSDGQWRIAGREDDDDEQPEPTKKGGNKSNKKAYILLYEDNEGDRMLVGDVPWELFMASVKRLYIAQDPRKTKI
ncbi:auxin-responsive protein IAA25-like [Miscanthus floridulus]|uniref:auxin-responsive protein IAA25-like n=1 Tax=Miscanthus floridulus TaxID=154761 RepID=UPI0034584381